MSTLLKFNPTDPESIREAWIQKDMYWRRQELSKNPSDLFELIEDPDLQKEFIGSLLEEIKQNEDTLDLGLNVRYIVNEMEDKVVRERAEDAYELEMVEE